MAVEPEVGTKRRREEEEEQSKAAEDTAKNAVDSEEYEEDDEEEDDDSDVEFILGPADSKPASQTEKKEPEAQKAAESTQPVQSAEAEEVTSVPAPAAAPGSETAPTQQQGTLDIDAVGTFNGQPISQLPPSSFDDKPWRRPGADLSDYFNYGFDEFTWMAYCSRQDKLRAHFTPQQVMQSMSMGGMGAPMPPMGGPMGAMPPMPFMMPPMMFPPTDNSRP